MTTGKTIALTRRTFVGKVMSLLFNMLSRLVINKLNLNEEIQRKKAFKRLILELNSKWQAKLSSSLSAAGLKLTTSPF